MTSEARKEFLPRSPNMEEAVQSMESYLPMVEVEGIKRRMTMSDPIEEMIPLGKTLFPFFYFLGFFIFIFLCLMIISIYQIKWTYHINRFIYDYLIKEGIESEKKDFFSWSILDLVSGLIL